MSTAQDDFMERLERLREEVADHGRRLGIAEARRDLASDRLASVSDRLSGVEHRMDDLRRELLAELSELRVESRDGFGRIIDAIADHVQGGHDGDG